MKERKLTRKEAHFVAELQDPNITQREAAIRAGFSVKNADSIASRLVKKSQVSEAVQKAMKERLLKIGVHAERVLTELARVGFSDIGKLFNEDGSLKHPKDWDPDTAAAVAGIQLTEEFEGCGKERKNIGTTKRVRMFDKVRALEMLMKHLKLFPTERRGEEGEPPKEHVPLSNHEVSAKVFYIVQLAIKKQQEREQRENKSKLPRSKRS